jgi:hypothetical protein
MVSGMPALLPPPPLLHLQELNHHPPTAEQKKQKAKLRCDWPSTSHFRRESNPKAIDTLFQFSLEYRGHLGIVTAARAF